MGRAAPGRSYSFRISATAWAAIASPRPNPKLTTPADLAYLEFLLNGAESVTPNA